MIKQPITYIRTYTGKKFDFLNLKPSSVCIEDIAHALNNICRFTGHTKRFYSVAEHSLLVMRICQRLYPGDHDAAFYALMHDATEAYTNDLCSPIKYLSDDTGLRYRELEEKIHTLLTSKFKLTKDPVVHAMVKNCDRIALDIEGSQLLNGWELTYVDKDSIGELMAEFPLSYSHQPKTLFEMKFNNFVRKPHVFK